MPRLMFDVSGRVDEITADIDRVHRKLVPQAASSSINATARVLIKESVKASALATGLPTKHMRFRYDTTGKVKKARRIYIRRRHKANTKRMWTVITAWHRDIPWTVLGAKDSGRYVKGKPFGKMRKGAGVRVRAGGYHSPDAFIRSPKHGGNQAFVRTGPKPMPLEVLKASVANTIRETTRQAIATRGDKYFRETFDKKFAAKLKKVA